MKKLFYVILLFQLVLLSCEKVEEYSDIPAIKFKDFTFDTEQIDSSFINQVGYLTFEFVDGDGNIGFYENADTAIDTIIYDVFIYEFTKHNESFLPSDTDNYWLPYFQEGVYRKYIKGDLEFKIYFRNQDNDTVKYSFQIMDRDHNLSNLESTPDIIVPEWN